MVVAVDGVEMGLDDQQRFFERTALFELLMFRLLSND